MVQICYSGTYSRVTAPLLLHGTVKLSTEKARTGAVCGRGSMLAAIRILQHRSIAVWPGFHVIVDDFQARCKLGGRVQSVKMEARRHGYLWLNNQ